MRESVGLFVRGIGASLASVDETSAALVYAT